MKFVLFFILFLTITNKIFAADCVLDDTNGTITVDCSLSTILGDTQKKTYTLTGGTNKFMTINNDNSSSGYLKNITIVSSNTQNEGIYILGEYEKNGDKSTIFGLTASHLSTIHIGDNINNGVLALYNDAFIDTITLTSSSGSSSLLVIEKILNTKDIKNISSNAEIKNGGTINFSGAIENSGIITNNGNITGSSSTITNTGTFNNIAGGNVTVKSITNNNNAKLNLSGGTLNSSSDILLKDSSELTLSDGTLNSDVFLNDIKAVMKVAGGTIGNGKTIYGTGKLSMMIIGGDYTITNSFLGKNSDKLGLFEINSNSTVILSTGVHYITETSIEKGGLKINNGVILNSEVINKGTYELLGTQNGKLDMISGKATITGKIISNYSTSDYAIKLVDSTEAILSASGTITGLVYGNGTLTINRNYDDATMQLGLSNEKLKLLKVDNNSTFDFNKIKGSAYLENAIINSSSKLNINNNFYLDGNIEVESNADVYINSSSLVYGTVLGEGTLTINRNYDDVKTIFGIATKSIKKVVANENLELKTTKHYVGDLQIANDKTITISDNGILEGNVYGLGTLTLLNNLNDKLTVGNSNTNKLSKFFLGDGNGKDVEFKILQNSWVDEITIKTNSKLDVNGIGTDKIITLEGNINNGGEYNLGKFGKQKGNLTIDGGGNAIVSGVLTGNVEVKTNGEITIEDDSYTPLIKNAEINGFVYGDGKFIIGHSNSEGYDDKSLHLGMRKETINTSTGNRDVDITWLDTLQVNGNLVLKSDAKIINAVNCASGSPSISFCSAHYAKNIDIKTGGKLTIDFSSGARIFGTVFGDGTLILKGDLVDKDDKNNTLNFGKDKDSMVGKVEVDGNLVFSDFGVQTENFFKDLTLKSGNRIELGTWEGSSDGKTATLNFYGNLITEGTGNFIINDEGILNLEKFDSSSGGIIKGIIKGYDEKGSGTININHEFFDGRDTLLGTKDNVIDIVNINEDVKFNANSQDRSNTQYINTVNIKKDKKLTLSNEVDIKGTIIGEGTLKIEKNYDDTNTLFGIDGTSITKLDLKDFSLSLKLKGNTSYIDVIDNLGKLEVENTLKSSKITNNDNSSINILSAGKVFADIKNSGIYNLDGYQEGKLENLGFYSLNGHQKGGLITSKEANINGRLDGDIEIKDGKLNLYGGNSIINSIGKLEFISNGKVSVNGTITGDGTLNVLGYYDAYYTDPNNNPSNSTITIFGESNKHIKNMNIGDDTHNAVLNLNGDDINNYDVFVSNLKIYKGSILYLGDSRGANITKTIKTQSSIKNYGNFFILDKGVLEGNLENYGVYELAFGEQTGNIINKGLVSIGDYGNISYSKLIGNLELEKDSSATIFSNNSVIEGSIYGDGIYHVKNNSTDSKTQYGSIINELAELIITGNNHSLKLSNNPNTYIKLTLIDGSSNSLELSDDIILNGDVAGSGTVSINDNSKINGNLELFKNGKAIINDTGTVLNSVEKTIYGEGKLILKRDYDDSKTTFGLKDNYLGILDITKNISPITFTISDKTNYISNVNIQKEQLFKIENNGILYGGVANNNEQGNLGEFGFTIKNGGSFFGINEVTSDSKTYLESGAKMIGTIYGDGRVDIGTRCNDKSSADCYNDFKESVSFGTSSNKLNELYVNGVNFTLQKEIYTDKFDLSNPIQAIQKEVSNGGYANAIYDKLLVMNKGSFMQTKINFGSGNYDVKDFMIVAFSAKDDTVASNLLYNVVNDSDLGIDAKNGQLYLLYGLSNSGEWNKIAKGSYNTNNMIYTYIDDNNNGSIFDRSWIMSSGNDKDKNGKSADTGFLSIRKCDFATENCNAFTPNKSELTVGAYKIAHFINDEFKINNSITPMATVLTTRLKSINNRLEFMRALESLSPHLFLNGAPRNLTQNIIENNLSTLNRRLSYHRNHKYGATFGEYNIPSSSNLRYYNDDSPFSQNGNSSISQSNFWYELFTGTQKQNEYIEKKEYRPIYGYDSKYYGFSIGYDVKPYHNFLMGLTYTFNHTTTKEDINESEWKSYNNIVGAHLMSYSKKHWFVISGGGGFGMNDSKRIIRPLTNSEIKIDAKSNFNNQYFYSKAEFGLNFILFENKPKDMLETVATNSKGIKKNLVRINVGEKDYNTKKIGNMNNYVMISPKIGLQGNLFKFGSVKEKGDSGANMDINIKSMNFFDTSFGADLTFSTMILKQDTLQFVLSYNYIRKLSGDLTNAKANFNDCPTSNDKRCREIFDLDVGNIQDTSVDYGIKVMWSRQERTTVSMGYLYKSAEKLSGHNINLNVSWSF